MSRASQPRKPVRLGHVLGWTSPILAGVVVWLVLSAMTDTGEAWDEGPYWWVMLAVAFLLGLAIGERPWRTGLSLAASQLSVLLVATALKGEEPTFLLVGVALFVVLGVLWTAVAALGMLLRIGGTRLIGGSRRPAPRGR